MFRGCGERDGGIRECDAGVLFIGEKEEFWFGFDRGKSASRPLYVGKK
ncbi:MAG: hypothetical protein ACLU4N_19510 [Butyricimonas faecihominis]